MSHESLQTGSDRVIHSVLGPIRAAEMGFTLPHEHILMDWMTENRLNGLLHDKMLMAEELGRFKAAGGRTVLDVTPHGLGRDPEGLREISLATGVNIVMGSGFYREPYVDKRYVDRHDSAFLAQHIVEDVVTGVGDTGIRAGVIGEIGQNRSYMSAIEERLMRAAGLAQVATGVAITTHAARWPVGIAQLDLLQSVGVDPRRVIIGHCDSVPIPEYHLAVAKRGAFVQFDTIFAAAHSEYELNTRIGYIKNLLVAGFQDRILLSHDICLTDHLHVHGGAGFDFLARAFVPALLDAGIGQDLIDTFTIENPANALPA